MNLTSIGIIHSPHKQATGTPVQSSLASGIEGTVEVFPEYAAGLRDLEGFDRIWLLYWFDRAKPAELVLTPYLDKTPRGLFARRSPCRPNPIGLSSVRLLGISANVLRVDGLDILDNTPLLDMKPYIPAFDAFKAKRSGWCGNAKDGSVAADGRFAVGESGYLNT